MTWTVTSWPYSSSVFNNALQCLEATTANGIHVVIHPGMWSLEDPAIWETSGYTAILDDYVSLSITGSRNRTGLTALNISKTEIDKMLARFSASRVSTVAALPK